MTAVPRKGPEGGAAHEEWEVPGQGPYGILSNKKGLEVRILCWNCQGQGLDSVQKVGNCTAWKMRLESSPETSKMYCRLVGRGHHGGSFLDIENTQICYSKV